MNNPQALVDLLAASPDKVFIQPHNFPDHDAVASAFGLQKLLESFHVKTTIVYDGELQRDSLKSMIRELGIELRGYREAGIRPCDGIVIVDGCKGNQNVTELAGKELAVLDHHLVIRPEDVPYIDIRSHLGSCSTLIYGYFKTLGVALSQEVATALLIGINMDTAQLTRDVCEEDVFAYSELYTRANVAQHNSILRNYIQTQDLAFYRFALEHVVVEDALAYCHFTQGCPQNMLGILADFFLALKEVQFVVMVAQNGPVVNFSVRSERLEWNAAGIIQTLLAGVGLGGGHRDMAGGVIVADAFDAPAFQVKLRSLLGI